MKDWPTIKLDIGDDHDHPLISFVGRGRSAYIWIGGTMRNGNEYCFATLSGVRLAKLSKMIKTITKPKRRKK